jgi:lipopolysaccharide/colanic/teichoic acid biosynthesis glycosyltransferase
LLVWLSAVIDQSFQGTSTMNPYHRLAIRLSTTADLGSKPQDAPAIDELRANQGRGKRVLDLMVACPLLLLCTPLLIGVAVLIRLTSPGPALIRQIRVGQNERPFTMFKFRTMYIEADDAALRQMNVRELSGDAKAGTSDGIFKLEADRRITRVGRLLRRFSVDELPQLLNVLRGEMSVVGPRPSLPWEVELFTPEQRRRHECLPGMTGLWQVSGRNRLSMPQMLALDLDYARSQSLRLDLWILCRTPGAAFFDRTVR